METHKKVKLSGRRLNDYRKFPHVLISTDGRRIFRNLVLDSLAI